MSSPDVVVAGAGAIGLSTAWRLAQAGLDVVVVDPEPVASASTVAAGLLAPVTEAHYGEGALLRLNLSSAELYPAFAAELESISGLPTGYRTTGTVVVAHDADDSRAIEELFRFQLSLGLTVERLRSRELRDLEPGLAPGVRGGLWVAGDHQVDPAALVGTLRTACEKANVRFVHDRVRAIRTESDSVTGVSLGNDSLSCGHVLIACGAWTPSIEGLPSEIARSIRPVKGQLVNLVGPPDDLPCDRNVRGLDVYVLPRADGRMVVGATMEEMGFDERVTAGAVHDLVRAAWELLPGVTELEFAGARVGFRPATPDNAPLIGSAGPRGLVIAAGHFRNGILLAPITAQIVTELVITGTERAEIAAFAPLRFQPATR